MVIEFKIDETSNKLKLKKYQEFYYAIHSDGNIQPFVLAKAEYSTHFTVRKMQVIYEI